MPEYPDITVYIEALEQRLAGRTLLVAKLNSLHRARLSPLAMTQKLSTTELERLFVAARETLVQWASRLRHHYGTRFPEKVTAFREGMAVHGRYCQPCPDCGTSIQRIRHADNETNYCPRCQTEGKVFADRALSRLLKQDWPRSVEERDERRPQ